MEKITTAIILDSENKAPHLDQNIPQGLTDVNGKSILQRQFEQLHAAGLKTVVISSHQYAEEYDKFIQEVQSAYPGMNIYSIKEKIPLGSGGAIKNTMLNTHIEHALTLKSNTYIDIDLLEFIKFHEDNNFENSACLSKNANGPIKSYLKTKDNYIESISPLKVEDSLYSSGIYILDVEIFNLTHLQIFSLSKDIFPSLSGKEFGAYISENMIYKIEDEDAYKSTIDSLK